MKKLHIEICHIYNDQFFGKEQIDSIDIFKDYVHNNKLKRSDYALSILIDDVNIDKPLWDAQYLINKLHHYNISADAIILESSFINIASEIINRIPKEYLKIENFKIDKKNVLFLNINNIKFALADYHDDKIKIKCVTLSTAWILCKMGILKIPNNCNLLLNDKNFNSENILSILPQKFKLVEEKVLILLQVLGYEKEIKQINYIYY